MKMAKATLQDFEVMNAFFQFLEDNESESESGMTDEVFGYKVRDWMSGRVASARNRVIFGCDILINNVCDPDKSYLDYKPELKKLMPETENEQGETLFYIISYKNTERGLINFWGANNAGYTFNIKCAGKYTETQVRARMDYYHQGESAIAVPVEEIHNGSFKIIENVWIDYDQKNKHFERVKAGILTDEKEVASE